MKTPYYSVRLNLSNNSYSVRTFNELHMPLFAETRILRGKNKGKLVSEYKYGYDNDNKLMTIVILEGNKNRTLTVGKAERAKSNRVYTLENALANLI